MSVRVVPYVRKPDCWLVDVRVERPDGSSIRKKKVLSVSKTNARRWGEECERDLLLKDRPEKREVPTVEEFAVRFIDGHARANRQKPSGIAAKETILRQHLIPFFGAKRLDAITTEQIQRLKLKLGGRSRKTVNNVLSVLNTMLKKAVEWGVLDTMPCAIRLLPTEISRAAFHDFEEFDRLVAVTEHDPQARLIVMLGGRVGLRCGEMMALEWADVNFQARNVTVARSEWKGQVTAPKAGRSRDVPLHPSVVDALRAARHLRSARVLCDASGKPLTQKMVQNVMKRVARKANVKPGVHILRHTFCSHLAMRGVPVRTIQKFAGHENLSTTLQYMHLSPQHMEEAIRAFDVATA